MASEGGKPSAGQASKWTGLRPRFWVEAACGASTGALAVVTHFWSDWIEVVLGVDPDHGNGSLEWLVATALAVITVSLVAAARVEWHHTDRRLSVSEG